MKKLFTVLLLVLSTSAPAPAYAASTLSSGRSCNDWTTTRQVVLAAAAGKVTTMRAVQDATLDFVGDSFYVLGYLTGSAVNTNTDVLKGVSVDTIYSWVDSYCQKKPGASLVDAADDLFEEMKANLRRK